MHLVRSCKSNLKCCTSILLTRILIRPPWLVTIKLHNLKEGIFEVTKRKKLRSLFLLDNMAERVGFEPTVGLHLRLISSQVHSTTLPPLHSIETIIAIESPLSRPYRAVAPWGS